MSLIAKRRYFDDLAARWDGLPKPEDAPLKVRLFLERVLEANAHSILDVGCGTGVLLPNLLELCPPTSQVCEMDFSLEMLRGNARKLRDPRVSRVCADATAPPFTPGAFDAILCFNVLPHLGAAEAALKPLLCALAPGGRLAVGHLMSSVQLNAFHAGLDEPVSGDRLPPASHLAALLSAAGALVRCAEERPGWYFVLCEKVRR